MPRQSRRLISIAHSYCVALNRRLAHEMARVGAGQWDVTVVAPKFFHGDLRRIVLETSPGELCHLQPVPVHFSSRIHLMIYGLRLREILKSDWDVIHCWEEPYILAGGQIEWWAKRPAVLVYVTGQNNQKRYPPPFNWIEQRAMRRASGWIAFGHTIEHALLEQPVYANRPRRIIPLGVDVNEFQPDIHAKKEIRQQLGWPHAEPLVIGFLGRFVPDKGLGFLMRVLDHIKSPWRALFVGGGPMETSLSEWGLRHGDRVRVVTGIKHDDVPAYLNAMDILCAPSQTMPHWREQFGRMLVEAFASGVPVIASDSGEIPYVVDDSGIIVGEKDETGWICAIEELLGNQARRAEISARGIGRAHSTYAWSVVAQQHLAFFNELLDLEGNGKR